MDGFFEEFLESKDTLFFVDTKMKLAFPEFNEYLSKFYPVFGGERCKSIDRVFELYTVFQSLKSAPENVVVFGGGSLFDLVGYSVCTSFPGCGLTLIPTTLSAQMTGFYKNLFYLNFDRKKDRLSVNGSADKIIIIPELLKSFSIEMIRKSHIIPFSVSISCEEKFFHLVKKSLSTLTGENVDSCLLYEMIRETNYLRIKEAGKGKIIFPGEYFANIIQSATGLRMEYVDAMVLSLRMELFISRSLGMIPESVYRFILNDLNSIVTPKKRNIDIQTMIEMIKDTEKHTFPILNGLGNSENASINSGLLEGIIKEFIIDVE